MTENRSRKVDKALGAAGTGAISQETSMLGKGLGCKPSGEASPVGDKNGEIVWVCSQGMTKLLDCNPRGGKCGWPNMGWGKPRCVQVQHGQSYGFSSSRAKSSRREGMAMRSNNCENSREREQGPGRKGMY
jgi:hypothetical protein